ncbi:MAG: bacteriohemerythrin [Gammaproteobacteria bacterium]|nr:bacteriohemerythrin [Gammaproteobacteria bacterium]
MIEWNETYLTGIEEIDLQHRYFSRLINRIETRLGKGGVGAATAPLLMELVHYARFHFLSEENLMAEGGFPGLAHHKQLHAELIERLNNEIHLLEGELVGPGHITAMLSDWFRDHTLVEDRKYVSHLQAHARQDASR